MIDSDGQVLSQGEAVSYRPGKGTTTIKATLISSHRVGDMVEIKIANDPFTSWVECLSLTSTTNRREHKQMPTKSAKTLRAEARKLGIDGWEDMDRDELQEAIDAAAEDADEEVDEDVDTDEDDEDTDEDEDEAPAKSKSKSKKAPAKSSAAAKKSKTAAKSKAPAKKAPASKKAAADDDEPSGPNPFREGSNLWHFTEALMKGGKRSAMVTKLERKVDLKPRKRGGKNYDVAEEIDYRLVRVCQLLTNEHGFLIEKEGRGKEQRVKAIPPEDQ